MKSVPLSRHFLLLVSVIVVILVLGAGFAMSTQASSASTHISSSEDSFSLVAKNLKATVVDLPPPGPSVGDLRIVTLDLYNQQGTQLVAYGDFFASLVELPNTATQPVVLKLSATFSFQGGTIEVAGLSYRTSLKALPTNDFYAITGGTGTYQGAEGEVHVTLTKAGVLTYTFSVRE